jgi:YD repeat-containing protein
MKIVYRYDALNRLVEAIWADGRRETYAYDAAGNRLAVSPAVQSEPDVNSLAAKAASPATDAQVRSSVSPPTVEKKSNRNLIIAIVVIVVLLCCCLPALIGIVYFIAKEAGVLPAWLGGTTWVPLILLQI